MIYRYPKEGQVSGVCLGLARYFGFDAWVIRLTVIILFFFGGYFFMPLLYIAGALLMEKAPDNYYISPPSALYNGNGTQTKWTSPRTDNNQIKQL
ncbi:PspC domain-containing protein [Conservatibacter flavescens]|uniref:Phage shock protein PspC N-terminal domain-containing protein n=1 Tax=Conservatibacter flavescens TaxID=28161 RepID=A0A2M8S0B4_9PAST|nr:PspC domain-containing protein [Conservatibacter flavescens]PJG84554.1 hypothetical protein CVP05_11070 [Conservatibacter flavescens]